MTYAQTVFADRNSIKRWLQRRRLASAVALNTKPEARLVVDFGAGNGELCKLLAEAHPQARILCYEPTPWLLQEARENLGGVPRMEFCASLAEIEPGCADVIYCLEVFEHLPEPTIAQTIGELNLLLHAGSEAIIGVPIETGLPALYKGLFRMARRFGEHDARPSHVLRAALGAPPRERPLADLAAGVRVHPHHLGFDHRALRRALQLQFSLRRESASPFPPLGAALNPEAYFVCSRR